MTAELLTVGAGGLVCARAGVHVDPAEAVPRALITHAHADHVRPDAGEYWCAAPGAALVARRAGEGATVHAVAYGEEVVFGDVKASWHPAGHMLGSAQIRLEDTVSGEVWVVAGDYKRASDPTCRGFEPVRCDVFVSEATFGLPIYRWPDPTDVIDELVGWWRVGAAAGRCSVVFAYAVGKSQRILGHLAGRGDLPGPIWLHGAPAVFCDLYREVGVALAETAGSVVDAPSKKALRGALVLAPLSAQGTAWMKRLGTVQTAFASGWMRIRGTRRRKGYDRGLLLSDHADWPALLRTIDESGTGRVRFWPGHGEALARHLRGQGRDARVMGAEAGR